MKRNRLLTLLIIGAIGGTLHARGFGGGGFGGFHGGGGFGGGGFGGGFHGGGFGGGGFGGGGVHGGNFGGGGFGGGGFHGGDFGGGGTHSFGGGQFGGGGFHDNFGGGEFGGSGFRGGGTTSGLGGEFGGDGIRGAGGLAGDGIRGAGGLGGDGFRGAGGFDGMRGGSLPTARSLNSFLGLPTDMGMHQAGAMPHSFGYSGDAHGLSAHEWTGPNGTTVAHGAVGERGAAVGPNSAAVGERGARGTVVQGPNGTTIAHGAAGERGAVVGPNAAVGGARGVRGTAVRGPEGNGVAHGSAVTRNWSSADLRVQGNYARANFNHYDCFNRGWYGHHPNAWWGGYAAGVWTGATWSALNGWFGADWPVYGYNYGNDITYVDNNVCLYGQPIATADDYYQSAADLVQTGVGAQVQSQPPPSSDAAAAPNPKNADWLPLGVYEALEPGEKSSKMMMQLAVNKAGIIRGNYFNTGDNNAQLIEGSINKKTARAAWCVADKKDVVFDTGLYNLTQDESPVLVHFGKDKQEQWTLVRLKQKTDSTTQK